MDDNHNNNNKSKSWIRDLFQFWIWLMAFGVAITWSSAGPQGLVISHLYPQPTSGTVLETLPYDSPPNTWWIFHGERHSFAKGCQLVQYYFTYNIHKSCWELLPIAILDGTLYGSSYNISISGITLQRVFFFVSDVVVAARRRFQKRLRLVRCDVFRGVRRDLSPHDVDLVINYPKKYWWKTVFLDKIWPSCIYLYICTDTHRIPLNWNAMAGCKYAMRPVFQFQGEF